MKAFTFVRPTTIEEASKAAAEKGSVIKAGGINLLDRMKERVDEPERVVWLGDLPKTSRSWAIGGGGSAGSAARPDDTPINLVIGSTATLADLASSSDVSDACPALAEAAGLAASPQLRQRATIAGNLLQHTRCGYYRHRPFPCFKRGDDVCPVLDDGAVQENAAIFANRPCASAHPSSLGPVLCAYDATLRLAVAEGTEKFVRLRDALATPKRGVASDMALPFGAVIDFVLVPLSPQRRFVYEEIRQKVAFDWSLASSCVGVRRDGERVTDAAIWLGSVAPTPWHAEAAEKALVGKTLSDEVIAAAAEAAVLGATPLPGNAYKVDLVKVVVRRALTRLKAMK